MDTAQEIARKAEQIETVIKKYLPREEGTQKLVIEAMNYSVLAGGKRLRPMLMQETYLLFSGGVKRKEDADALHSFMAAQEMIHTYSLVHDDLPAMDNDDYRRGRKTTHVVYGEDMGILAGILSLCALIERQWYPTNAKYYLQQEGLPINTVCRVQDAASLSETWKEEIKILRGFTQRLEKEYLGEDTDG